jgi:hypothetical protein
MFSKTGSIPVLVTLSLIALFGAGQALAHASLKTADPAPNATVAAPKMIRLLFSEEIAKKFSTFTLTDTDGNPVPTMSMDSQNAKGLAAMPAMPLAPGLYTVSWIAVSTDDGHKTMGTFSFTVQ